MSATSVKASRREIRKAFGNDATALIKTQHEALKQHAKAIDLLVQVVFARNILGRVWWLLSGR